MGLLDEVKPGDIGNNTRNGFFPAREATYKVRVENCKNKPETDGSGTAFIAELEVLESDNDEVEAGDFKDWYRGTDVKGFARKMAAKDLVTFLCAATGFDPDKPADREAFFAKHQNGAKLLEAAGSENKLDGAVMKLRTYAKKTKAGGDFTVHCWSPCEDDRVARPTPPLSPPPAADPFEGCERSPCGNYALKDGRWYVLSTGQPA